MLIRIHGSERLDVHDADNLTQLKVRANRSEHVDAALRHNNAGKSVSDQHAWLDVDWLRSAGGTDPEWNRRFDAMIDYASSKGWVDQPNSAVRAHIELD